LETIEKANMNKIEKCPKCGKASPSLTLRLTRNFLVTAARGEILNTREYELICLECGEAIEIVSIDNTIQAAMDLHARMDNLYGSSYILPYV
jgi:hypothetical protein